MNQLDLLILLALLYAVIRGMRYGLLNVLFSMAGTIIGLFLGGWLGQVIAPYADSEALRMLTIVGAATIGALLVSEIAVQVSKRLTTKTADLKLERINEVLGATLEVFFILVAVWIVAPSFSNTTTFQAGRQIRTSFIIGGLNGLLGEPPDVFHQVATAIAPNGFPNVFVGDEPIHDIPAPSGNLSSQQLQVIEESVVKIEGRGCGGILSGTGWVVDPGIVVTNAHVIAGVNQPVVIRGNRQLQATPLWFDQNLDVAVLSVPQLTAPALPTNSTILADNSGGTVIGYPGGGAESVSPGTVIDSVQAVGKNIYNQGRVRREIYELAAAVEHGNSGGPFIDNNGAVAGMVFAKSVTQNGVGYALTMRQILPSIRSAEARNTPVRVGTCTAD